MMNHLLIITTFICCFAVEVQAQVWTQEADYPSDPRHHPICFSIDNYAYLTTGVTDQSTVLNDFLRFDKTTETWETLTDFPGSVRGFGVGTQLDGKGYIGFGVNGLGQLNDLWEYDPATEAWTELASCPCDARAHPAFVATNGKIFVGLGNNDTGNYDDWWEYDVATDTWAQKPDFPGIQRHHPYYFAIGDTVYVGMGHGPAIYNDWYRYFPVTETWTQLGDLPDQGRVAGTHFSYGNKGYVMAGQDESHSNNNFDAEFWEYDPTDDSWVQLPSVPLGKSRWAPGCFVLDSSLYFTSGERAPNEGGLNGNDVWHYQLPSLLPPPDTTISSTITNINTEKQFLLYPNPTNGMLTVTQNLNAIEDIVVYNIQGQRIVEERGSQLTRLNFINQPKGLYIIQVGAQRKKFVVE